MLALKFTRGKVIRLLREQKGLPQHQLGVNKTTISQLELDNREPDHSTVAALEKFLGASLVEIDALVDALNEKGKPEPSVPFSPEHIEVHSKLERILHEATRPARDAVLYGIEAVYGTLPPSSSAAQERHGPFRPAKEVPIEEAMRKRRKRKGG